MWMFNGYGMGAAGWLLMVLVWVVLIALVVFLVMRLFPGRGDSSHESAAPAEQPQDILRRRLASGEIDLDTYERLSSKLGPPSPAGKG